MSKFQVGDKVIFGGRHLEVVGLLDNGGIWIGSCGKGWIEAQEGDLVHDDPHVPDVDGNPIRVGQLVEDPDGEFARVERFYEHETELTKRCMWARLSTTAACPAHKLRVLTADDLLRPPVPDTRDVTLRVTFQAVTSDIDSGALAADVEGELDHCEFVNFTVEVVDDGGHDDG